jgi:hypothetical protein
MDKKCTFCFVIGWVCENHPDHAWHDELVVCAARESLADANNGDEPDKSEVLIEESDITRH